MLFLNVDAYFFYFAKIFSIVKKDLFYSIRIRLILFIKLVNITDSTLTKIMKRELPLPANSTDSDNPSRNIDLNLNQEEKYTVIFLPVFRPDNIMIYKHSRFHYLEGVNLLPYTILFFSRIYLPFYSETEAMQNSTHIEISPVS